MARESREREKERESWNRALTPFEDLSLFNLFIYVHDFIVCQLYRETGQIFGQFMSFMHTLLSAEKH